VDSYLYFLQMMRCATIPVPSDNIMANTEQVAQIAIQNTSRYICTYWRPSEQTILVEYVDEHEDNVEDSITWFETPDTMIIGETVSYILNSDIYWNNDLSVSGDDELIDMSQPVCCKNTYFNNRWLDYAEKRFVFQSTVCLLHTIA